MHRSFKTAPGASLAAAVMLMILFVSLRAQQPPAPAQQPKPQPNQTPAPATPAGRGAAPGAAPAAPAPKPLVPVATNTIAANPDAYYGQAVTITASVEQIFTKSSFAVDQRRVADAPAPKNPTDVLVLVPTIQRPVDLKSYVTVMGELIKFDPAEVAKKAKDYKIDLPPDAAAKYAGRPALIATSVINDKFDDVAKRLPPPLTAEEEAFQKVMRAVGPAAAALRPAVEPRTPRSPPRTPQSCRRDSPTPKRSGNPRRRNRRCGRRMPGRKSKRCRRRSPPATGTTPRRTPPPSPRHAASATASTASASTTGRSESRSRNLEFGIRHAFQIRNSKFLIPNS